MELSSRHNPRIKEIIKLRDKRIRDKTERFLIEGYRELSRALEGGVPLEALFISPAHFLGSSEETLVDQMEKRGVSLFSLPPSLFDTLSYRDRPDGLLAVARQTHLTLSALDHLPKKNATPFLLIAEAIEKPGNLGSILRSADAAGIDALLVCDRCTDIFNPNVVRASVGTLFTLPVIEAASEEAIAYLKEREIPIIATSPAAPRPFTQVPLTGPVAIAMGTEQLGLSKVWMEAATEKLSIPMHGVADSLNVAAATTLLLYEVVRQRDAQSYT